MVAHYAYGLFTSIGCLSYFPKDDFEIQSMVEHVNDDDILFLVSLTGENNEMIQVVEQSRLKSNPTIVAITWSGNNTLQNLCDIDFYVFTEQVTFKGYDLTSRVSMVALIEILVHHIIANKS